MRARHNKYVREKEQMPSRICSGNIKDSLLRFGFCSFLFGQEKEENWKKRGRQNMRRDRQRPHSVAHQAILMPWWDVSSLDVHIMSGLEIITSFYLSLPSVSSQLHAGYCPSHILLYQTSSFGRNVDKFSYLEHHNLLARDVRHCSLERLEPFLQLVGDRTQCSDDHCCFHSPPSSPVGSLLLIQYHFFKASVAIQIVSEHFTQGLTPNKQLW